MSKKHKHFHIQELRGIIGHIVNDEDFRKLQSHRHHMFFNRYEHLLHHFFFSYSHGFFVQIWRYAPLRDFCMIITLRQLSPIVMQL